MPSIHEIEPELLSRLPRRIERRRTSSGRIMLTGAGCVHIFLLPFILIGMWLAATLLHRILLPFAGATAPAVITGRETQSDDDGDTYTADFTYTYNGVQYTGSCKVDPDVYSTLETGQMAQVEILSLTPGVYPRLSNPPGKYPFGSFIFLVVFTLFWDGIVALFVWTIYVWPVIAKRIYQWGTPAVATIVDKKTVSGEDSATYTIAYEFTPGDIHGRPGSTIVGRQSVPESAWKEASTGDRCTVLYSPKRPRMNVLYRYGDYQVIEQR